MRTFIAILLVLIFITCWLVLELRAKSKYDQARREDAIAYLVTAMDQQTVAFLARVQGSWTCWEDITNGADSETLKLVGKSPTVRNLIYWTIHELVKKLSETI
jgi:sensor domain CHASE-containing protein